MAKSWTYHRKTNAKDFKTYKRVTWKITWTTMNHTKDSKDFVNAYVMHIVALLVKPMVVYVKTVNVQNVLMIRISKC